MAKLFAKTANTIVLDEPTNDLDTETLELLEQRLVEYGGTVLLVSHDRTFLNNVVTSTLVFEHDNVKEYAGGYDDWLRQRAKPAGEPSAKRSKTNANKENKSLVATANSVRKLSYKERRELESLPARIEELELEIAQLHEELANPGFYQQSKETIAHRQAYLTKLDEDLAAAYARWETLE